ncbi:rhythmically expressed gene 2 protein [Onthophagus taurus]|uniref:rhythmically expressed gene 2 protein n=1 Tax=Onthophagus taurus TaxID=166361 RepID=UPI000C1FF063|nr:rhythmically expressed gene 2 protein [Onthophagus taurus]
MNISRLKLITFDVTNTLLKLRSSPGKQYGEIGAIYGVLRDDNKLAENFRKQWQKMNREYPNFGLRSGLHWSDWWKQVVKGTFADTSYSIEDSKLDHISTHLIDLYKTSICWQPCFGAKDLLIYLSKKEGLTIGVISNFDPRCSTALENTKLREYLKFVLTSYETGYEKPDPRIFEKAMETSGIPDLKPEQCLHIGDRAMIDYSGAKSAYWNAILVNDKHPEEIRQKYPYVDLKLIFQNLYDLHVYFKNMK